MKNSTSREVAKLEAAMAVREPVIRWRLDPVRRVHVAWYVDDPYMDHGPCPKRQAAQLAAYAARPVEPRCGNGHDRTPENTNANGRCKPCDRDAAAAYRERQRSPLMQAARSEL